MVLYDVKSAKFRTHLAPTGGAPEANEVLSAHSTISTLVSTKGGMATFRVLHYLRYAQLNSTVGDSPQEEWSISIRQSDAQTARFVEEAEGSISEVIRALDAGSMVVLDWLQVALRSGAHERVERPCQRLEPISAVQMKKLLAANPEVEINGLSSGMETLLRTARSHPDALAALQAASQKPGTLSALKDAVANGLGVASKYVDDPHASALLSQLGELGVLAPPQPPTVVAFGNRLSTIS